jgi:HprK-related kinase A
MTRTLSALAPADCVARLQSRSGLRLATGPFVISVSSALPAVSAAVGTLYADYPVLDEPGFVDFHVSVHRPRSLRRWWNKQVVFGFEGDEPFNPLPGDQGFPLLEWGLNWCVYGMCHQYLILHAAVLERNGRALILPAPSGSGKSTLCAGLLFNGWRLLSDELTLISPSDGQIVPIPRPVSLKNQSIGVIQRLVPHAIFGSQVEETSKGVVAHFRPPLEAVRLAAQRAAPAWIVMPRFVAEQPALLQPVEKARALMCLIENAFNFDVFGLSGFELLRSVVDRSQCFTFEYSHLPDAIAMFSRLADGQRMAADAPTWG